jgi:hypothetical protein
MVMMSPPEMIMQVQKPSAEAKCDAGCGEDPPTWGAAQVASQLPHKCFPDIAPVVLASDGGQPLLHHASTRRGCCRCRMTAEAGRPRAVPDAVAGRPAIVTVGLGAYGLLAEALSAGLERPGSKSRRFRPEKSAHQ